MSDATAQITFAELATTGRSPRDWIRERCDEMRAAGVTHLRVTDLKEHDLLLLEGWLVVPEVAHGKPQAQAVAIAMRKAGMPKRDMKRRHRTMMEDARPMKGYSR